MRAGRTLPNLLWSTTSTCFCAIDMAQCFTGNSSRLKQVAPLLTCTPPRNKSDIRAKIIQRLLKIDGFENGVAGVKFTTAKKRAAMRFLFQCQKVFSE